MGSILTLLLITCGLFLTGFGLLEYLAGMMSDAPAAGSTAGWIGLALLVAGLISFVAGVVRALS